MYLRKINALLCIQCYLDLFELLALTTPNKTKFYLNSLHCGCGCRQVLFCSFCPLNIKNNPKTVPWIDQDSFLVINLQLCS